MKLKGKAHKFGNNINTDEIIPARYLNITDAEELGKHCMEDADKEFAKKVKSGGIIVAGENFGCGSSREHAPIAIKGCGVSLVIAQSFARIFYRNCINIGLPILESKEAASQIKDGDEVEVDLSTGTINNLSQKVSYSTTPFPEFLQEIIQAGGLMEWYKTSKKANVKG